MSEYFRFLGLPSCIRAHIYQLIIADDEAQLPTQAPSTSDTASDWKSGQDIHNLLLTHPRIYAELSYAQKHLVVQYRNNRSLQKLHDLTPVGIQSLVKLTVLLNVSTCEPGWGCCKLRSCGNWGCNRHDQPLSSTSPHYHEVLEKWYSAIEYIGPFVRPNRLQLFFICDVTNMTAARAVVEPLLNGALPTLRECNIRLSTDVDSDIRQIAHRAAKKAMGHSVTEPQSPFPFLALPSELRHRILQYTDLVTPFRELSWSPRSGYHVTFAVDYCEGECAPEDHHASLFHDCWKRPAVSDIGCFCSRFHSVFSNYCQCWHFPSPFFLVCRAFRKDALYVLFTQNRCIVTPVDGYGCAPKTVLSCFESSIFLRDIVPSDYLCRLKFLEIVFPPVDEEYLEPRGPALQDWEHTIDYFKDKLNLPNLTLRIYFADFYGSCHAPVSRKKLGREEGTSKVLGAYMRIIRPLEKLKANGLTWLFVHAAWPWTWTRDGGNTLLRQEWIVKKVVNEIEKRLESQVMGEGYDSALLGKNGFPKSQWLKDHEMYEDFACWCANCHMY